MEWLLQYGLSPMTLCLPEWSLALRFLIQRDVVVIPKSTHKERMIQNLNVFDFTLSAEEMEAIGKLDKGESLFFSHYAPDTVKFLTSLGK